MEEQCFCHLNGYEVKDANAREKNAEQDLLIQNNTNTINKIDNKIGENSKVYYMYRGNNGGTCQLIKTGTKNIILDLGQGTYKTQLVNYLIEKEATKIDYLIISHMDTDHILGSAANFRELINNTNLDFSDCTFIFHKSLEWENFLGHPEYLANYNAIISFINEKGYSIKYPTFKEEIELDENNKLIFLNNKDEYYAEYYSLYSSENVTDPNNFSLVTLFNSNGVKYLFPGDINKESEEHLAGDLESQIDVMSIPHHGVNLYYSPNLMKKMKDIGIAMNTTTTYIMRPYIKYYANFGKLFTSNESGNIIITNTNGSYSIDSDNGEYQINYNNIITSNTDLNTLKKTGEYYCNEDSVSQSCTNVPSDYTSQFILIAKELSPTIGYQYLLTFNSNPIVYIRKFSPSGFTKWQKLHISGCTYKSFIRCYVSSSQDIEDNAWLTIPFDSVKIEQSNGIPFSLNADGSIQVPDGTNLAKITAMVTFSNMTAGNRINVAILKGTTVIARTDCISEIGYNSFMIPGVISDCNKNDVFKIQVRNLTGGIGKVSNGNYETFIQVESI